MKIISVAKKIYFTYINTDLNKPFLALIIQAKIFATLTGHGNCLSWSEF